MPERKDMNLMLAFKYLVKHPVAVKYEQFTNAGIVLFGYYAPTIRKLAQGAGGVARLLNECSRVTG